VERLVLLIPLDAEVLVPWSSEDLEDHPGAARTAADGVDLDPVSWARGRLFVVLRHGYEPCIRLAPARP
jgi:hypothetical protein